MAQTDPNLDAPTVPIPDLHGLLAETDPDVAAAIAVGFRRQKAMWETPRGRAGGGPRLRSAHSTGRRAAAHPRTTVPARTTSETEWR